MHDIGASLVLAYHLAAGGDPELWGIVRLSLAVSMASAALACAMGLPLGALVAVTRFPGRRAAVVVMNALLGLPSVVVGLVFYILLSRAGPLGDLGILFTPAAIVIAQTFLVLPVVAALSRQFVEDAWLEYRDQLTSLGVKALRAVPTLIWDLRYSLLTVVLVGLGRAASEVGAVMIVGGNIAGVTRVMTTAIALETEKGDLPLALALGVILLSLVLALNALAELVREWSMKRHG
ncbi:MAG TPA: ABC transporter permease [Usitatibacter sp.]|jgi:tungstate transport system permease protein|nr:ABC transporter permease [Usitatibacter sp.]